MATDSKSLYRADHSSFSPSAASSRFSAVLPIRPAGYSAVMETIPPCMNLKNRVACANSCSAVSANMPMICSYPSSFAFWANNV